MQQAFIGGKPDDSGNKHQAAGSIWYWLAAWLGGLVFFLAFSKFAGFGDFYMVVTMLWTFALLPVYLSRGGSAPGYSPQIGLFASYRKGITLLLLPVTYAGALFIGALPLVVSGLNPNATKIMLLALFLMPASLPFEAANWWLARRVGDRPTMQTALWLWLPALLLAQLACWIVLKMLGQGPEGLLRPVHYAVALAVGPLYLLTLVSMHYATLTWQRLDDANVRADAADTARHLAEARLAVLQAQIEPHFLFNTLATVEYLVKSDPDKAAMLLTQLTRYLRLAMPSMRQLASTLGREFELTDAYLQIAQARMGGRLAVDVDLPDALLAIGFPSLVVQTLVENAIKHGVEPKPGPVRIRVFARQVGAELHVGVQDNGVGLSGMTAPGGGTGLQNIRERLRGLHGERAQLSVVGLAEGGVLATVVVPLQP